MLTHADKQIVANDTALPGLILLLDAERLLEKLRQLPVLNSAIQADIQYLRYKPNSSCACTVRVTLAHGEQKYYYAKALTSERFKQSWQHPKRQKLVQEGDPNAPLALFDYGIMLLHPAYDRGIRHLAWLVDHQALQTLLHNCHFPYCENTPLHIEVLRYKPERRFVAKISQHNKPLAVVRSVKARDFSHVLTGTVFGVAQGHVKLYGVDGQRTSLITHWQTGKSLCPEAGNLIHDDVLKPLATCLVEVHQASYLPPIQHDIAAEIKALKGVEATFQHILPDHAEYFRQLMQSVIQGLQAHPQKLVLIHGDFSLDQVVASQDQEGNLALSLLDWDSCVAGYAFMDLATMQARLELQVIEGVLSAQQATHIMAMFLTHYQQGSQLDLQGIHYFIASALLRLATEPFRKRGQQWESESVQLLTRTAEILQQALSQNQAPNVNHEDFSADPLLAELTDPQRMQALLVAALPSHLQGKVTSAKLTRYKVQRRALIEYDIQTEQGTVSLMGKYRHKGVDKRSFTVQNALWKLGFNASSPVSVPEPVGILPEQKLWLQRKVKGQTVGEMLIPQHPQLAFLGQRVAEALKALHQSAVENVMILSTWTIEKELAILSDRLQKAQSLRPTLAKRIEAVLHRCEGLAVNLTSPPWVSLHRDFYQDQILVHQDFTGQMVLLDLDLLCQGHAALDAGNYLAHIQEFALRQYGDIHALSVHQNAFLTTFLTSNSTATALDVEIYTVLSLVRHIYLSTQFEDRGQTTEALLLCCEQKLDFLFKQVLN
ncbi:phosphotransferase [Pasteurella sp. PK-2025]|uniref:phosphotransferase n=1 Tax=Pasteurella sp. PK-2025 TaxID=3413133 RepID=UPI003C72BAD7